MRATTAWWVGTLAALSVLLMIDLAITSRQRRRPTSREAALGVAFYIGTALAFGALIWVAFGARFGGEFAAGWLTEYSLSVDNLFVFMVLMARFAVPSSMQSRVLTIGIVLALVLRGTLIAAGSAAIEAFSWVFYVFGIFLLWTAWKLLREGTGGTEAAEAPESTRLVSFLQRRLRTTTTWSDGRLTVRENGRRVLTPMLTVMLAIGMTDVLFALDSIPAIFGLTQEPFLVVTANAFALLGLRQLYFLVEGLLDRLVHLGRGLSVVLGFIAVKLVLEAMRENDLPFVNGGRPIEGVPQIPVWTSLAFVIGTLLVTTATSLISERLRARRQAQHPSPGAVPGPVRSRIAAPAAGTEWRMRYRPPAEAVAPSRPARPSGPARRRRTPPHEP